MSNMCSSIELISKQHNFNFKTQKSNKALPITTLLQSICVFVVPYHKSDEDFLVKLYAGKALPLLEQS